MFQLSDVPRLLPELLLLVLAILVYGSDLLERRNTTPDGVFERNQAAGQLAAVGLGLVAAVALVQSGWLFTVPEPRGGALDVLINLGRNLQAGGAPGEPVVGAFAIDGQTMIARMVLPLLALLAVCVALADAPIGRPGEFYGLLVLATLGLCALAGASELIFAAIAIELAWLALLGAIAVSGSGAARRLALPGALASAATLYGMSLTYGIAATTNRTAGTQAVIATLYSELGRALGRAAGGEPLLLAGVALLIGGLLAKLALPLLRRGDDLVGATDVFAGSAMVAGIGLGLARLVTEALGGAALGSAAAWAPALAALAALTTLACGIAGALTRDLRRGGALLLLGQFAALLPLLLLGQRTLFVAAVVGLALAGALAAGGLALWQRSGSSIGRLTAGLALLALGGLPPFSGFWGALGGMSGAAASGAIWLTIIAAAAAALRLATLIGLLPALGAVMTPDSTRRARWLSGLLLLNAALLLLVSVAPRLIER